MREPQSVTNSEQKPAQVGAVRAESLLQPFAALRSEMDRLFDSFWRGIGAGGAARRAEADPQPLWGFESGFGLAVPAIDVLEAEKEFRIKAELPGMDANDVELALSDGVLTIKGEKKDEHEEKTENYRFAERRFGSFRRSFQLPRGIDHARVAASFDKGVLTVTLPKTADAAAQQRRIDIKQGP
ncbi:Hsp20/alpha crystallin family protein [Falsiroseomonas tokyonensis]|uniref:Hsp20/alpha crystallin family protein n=1 Tax=Falsiroseomonas tokyonensis TaxID=430521 RepID=A0ABV7C0J5_9PROT|nr:Hsp20/alpha crystallin family protein [Falsiroseomonas tokyonensis]MBU8541417.1 Hsp20/alpha crystallin family protein [Falsiroseomonas tokyonensis]